MPGSLEKSSPIMPEISPVAELLGHAIYQFEAFRPILLTYGHLILSALFPIVIGAHGSLSRPSSAAKPPKRSKRKDAQNTDSEDQDEGKFGPVQKMEGLEPSDAVMLPLTAGLTLGGLYLVIKWLDDPAILNKILGFYFSQMGIFFAMAFLKDAFLIVRSFVFPRVYVQNGRVWRAKQSERIFTTEGEDAQVRHSPLPGALGRIPLPNCLLQMLWACRSFAYQRLRLRAHFRGIMNLKFRVGLLDFLSVALALSALGYFTFVAKPWWLTNFLGFSFCYGSLQFMSPSTFATGSLILGSLFFYDIYFVFFTPLMVTVATKLDVPIKLLIPRPPKPSEDPDVTSLAMLGLGDIVIPGMMIGLALRFDLFLYYKRKGAQKALSEGKGETSVKPQYQTATGAWGERFWARLSPPRELELEPPYHDARSFPKTYFKAGVVGYIAGMVTTLVAMHYSEHAQPALLYLVPGVLISLWGTALARGELRTMWDFSDAVEDEENETDKKKDQKESPPKTSKGLFMRMLTGEIANPPRPKEKHEKDNDSQETQKQPEDKNSKIPNENAPSEENKKEDSNDRGNRSSKDEETEDSGELVCFSISLPRKSRPSKSENVENDAVTKDQLSTPRKGDGEPPSKRRRHSPEKTKSEGR